jgi:four helix bundle protein
MATAPWSKTSPRLRKPAASITRPRILLITSLRTLWGSCSGIRDWGIGFRDQGSGIRVQKAGARVQGLGFRVKKEKRTMSLKTYKELKVWQKAMELVEEVYTIATHLPQQEQFGLKSQMCRAAVSIPANIAEGYGRMHRGDYLHHLSIAMGSLTELETHLEISTRLKYLKAAQLEKAGGLVEETSKMLTKLIQSLKKPRE